MLSVEGLAMSYPGPSGPKQLFGGLSFQVPLGGRLAVLGRNGQGKSTLIKILGGVLAPTAGQVSWSMRPSWPLGFSGGFQGGLTGLDNIRFVARIYGQDPEAMVAATEAFAALGKDLYTPAKHYSSGMRARLAFGLSLAIEFDCYLIDEVIAVGDQTFRAKCQRELFDRRAERAFIIASHDVGFLRATCERALVIDSGRAKMFDDIDTAIDVYLALGETLAYRVAPERSTA